MAAYLGLGSQSSNDTIPPKVPPRSYSAPSRSSSVSISPYAHLVTLEEARTEYSKRQAYLDRIASELGVRVKYDTEGTACSAHLDALVKRFSPRSRISFRKEDMNLDLYETAVVPFTHFSVGRDDHPRVYVFRKFFSFGWIPDKKSLKVSSDDIAPAGVLVPGRVMLARLMMTSERSCSMSLFMRARLQAVLRSARSHWIIRSAHCCEGLITQHLSLSGRFRLIVPNCCVMAFVLVLR